MTLAGVNETSDVLENVSFLLLFQRIWNSLDDILVSLGVFLIACQMSRFLHYCLRFYFNASAYMSQATHFVFLFTVFIFLVSHLLGASTAASLFGGFSIGFGYAMQPYIVSFVAGGTFMITRIVRAGDQLTIGDKTVTVHHVGLLYVAAKNEKSTTYFPTAVLAQAPFSVTRL